MRTRNAILLVVLLVTSLLLAACGGTSGQKSTGTESTANSGSQGSTALSKVNMLLVGTLKLDGTNQAVTKDEAAQLLTLWQAYLSLSNSQTAAEAEVDALVNQIQSTMTADQVKAIQEMNLTNTDMMNLMQTLGGGMGPQGTPNPQSTPGFDFPSGGFQYGNPPEGMQPPSSSAGGSTGDRSSSGGGGPIIVQGGPGMGGDVGSTTGLGGGPMVQGTQDPSMQATAQARFSTQASQVNPMLLNLLIRKLETMAGGSPTSSP